jgi:tetratricopeptide (TPR) repeat protein
MDTVVFVDQKAITYFTDNMVLAKFNAEKDSSWVNETGDTMVTAVKTDVARHYQVSAYPTMVLVDSSGEEIDRIVGYMEVDTLLATLNNYQSGIGTLADLLSKAQDADDRMLFFEIADKYKYRGAPEDAKGWYEKVITTGDEQDSLSAECKMALADMSRRAEQYEDALAQYQAIENDFKGTSFGADGVIYQAIVYGSMGDSETAIKKFEQYVKDYPEADGVDYAKRQLKRLKGEENE